VGVGEYAEDVGEVVGAVEGGHVDSHVGCYGRDEGGQGGLWRNGHGRGAEGECNEVELVVLVLC